MRPGHLSTSVKHPPPILLCVLDGWGVRAERTANAIALAGTPALDSLARDFPTTKLETAGLCVGLPDGQMGNSEVGHTNIGAGRIVYQDLVRINRAAQSPGFENVDQIRAALDFAASRGTALHLLGLTSPGGVHSSMEHLFGLLRAAKQRGVSDVFVHAFLDGRDTPPRSAHQHIEALERECRAIGIGTIASVCGRFYAMDRDQRWERIQRAFAALVRGEGHLAPNAQSAIAASYAAKVTDEFFEPTVLVTPDNRPIATIRDGDTVIFFNFRADRARELTAALTQAEFRHFDRGPLRVGHYLCMTQYDETWTHLPVAFPPEQPTHILPELIARRGWRQFRTAETEKYAHVTFFFNGGRELIFPGEERHLVPSPRDVKTYDLKPQMSAAEVTDELIRRIESGGYQFALVNIANGDMVGHTGNLEAALKAVRVVDDSVGRLRAACEKNGWGLLVTADHGNIEMMVDPVTGEPHTQHTLNPVPLYLAHPDAKGAKLAAGVLADVAPTICTLLGLEKPAEMNRLGLL